MNFSIQSIYNWYRSSLRNPKYRWWIILGSLTYLLSPIDISPDIFPVIGWIDDGVIATLLVTELSQILMERLKPAKETETPTATSTDSKTVDVNAVSAE